MSRSEQNVVREMCQAFLHDAVPEYIRDTAYYILSEGGVQKINIQEGETWEAQGVIQGEDLQVYTPSLTFSITDRSTRHQCNCSESFTSTCRHVAALALRLLEELEVPVVLDADGINALAGHIDVLDGRKAPTVLTPHEGEFARLTGCGLPVRGRVEAAQRFAAAHRCTVVLKGHGTVTAAPDGRVWVNPTGTPGMAKGGSGDVLAGMTAALWGQKLLRREENDLPRLAAAAVYYHGLAGDLCARRLGEYAMLPGDMIEALPEVLKGQED